MPKPDYHIFVCVQQRPDGHPRGSCMAKGAGDVFQAFSQSLTQNNLFAKASLTSSGCIGPCQTGANVLVFPGAVLYGGVEPGDVERIVQEHIIGGEPVAEMQLPDEIW